MQCSFCWCMPLLFSSPTHEWNWLLALDAPLTRVKIGSGIGKVSWTSGETSLLVPASPVQVSRYRTTVQGFCCDPELRWRYRTTQSHVVRNWSHFTVLRNAAANRSGAGIPTTRVLPSPWWRSIDTSILRAVRLVARSSSVESFRSQQRLLRIPNAEPKPTT